MISLASLVLILQNCTHPLNFEGDYQESACQSGLLLVISQYYYILSLFSKKDLISHRKHIQNLHNPPCTRCFLLNPLIASLTTIFPWPYLKHMQHNHPSMHLQNVHRPLQRLSMSLERCVCSVFSLFFPIVMENSSFPLKSLLKKILLSLEHSTFHSPPNSIPQEIPSCRRRQAL